MGRHGAEVLYSNMEPRVFRGTSRGPWEVEILDACRISLILSIFCVCLRKVGKYNNGILEGCREKDDVGVAVADRYLPAYFSCFGDDGRFPDDAARGLPSFRKV